MLFIINPISGKGKKLKLAEKLLAKGYKVLFTEYAGHAEELAREATDDVVVAVGGDGTVNEVARGLVGSNKALGIIPCGSGDGLARHLGLSHNVDKALKTIERGECKSMDVADVNGRMFFSVCGVGFDAVVSERFAKCGKRGLANYIKQGLKTWKEYTPERYTIEIDGVSHEMDAFFITVGNSSQWGNHAKIAPRANISDGMLDITAVDRFSSIEIPSLAVLLMTGTLDKNHHVHCYRGRNIKITRSVAGPAHADGDWFSADKEINICIRPHSLNVIIP